MKLAIVGYRKFEDYDLFEDVVLNWIDKNKRPIQIISGGASGADAMAKRFAGEHGIPFVDYEAQWSGQKLPAGPIRNSKLVKVITHMLAFPSKKSIGTWDAIKKAERRIGAFRVTVHKV